MTVRDIETQAELFAIERPFACQAGPCKCCCYQQATFTSDGNVLGTIEEEFYLCVPSFLVRDDTRRKMYRIHPPTCCLDTTVNCCTEGNPCCGDGCCKVPFWIYHAKQYDTNRNDAEPVGKIVKQMKSIKTELLTDANAFDVVFPSDSSVEQKAILSGSAVFFNSLFFEGG